MNWSAGFGVIRHSAETTERAENLVERHRNEGALSHPNQARALFAAADRLANAAMWVVAHMSYVERVNLGGRALEAEDFKSMPEGHMGGSLNMAIAFVGYMLANALSGDTRAWLLGQGYCVAAIEAVNALIGDVSDAQLGRYYAYALTPDGRPAHPLGWCA